MLTLDTPDNAGLARELAQFYGDTGTTPTARQWQDIIEAADAGPVCIVNFIKLRPQAIYENDAAGAPCSGLEAFMRYSGGSVPRIGAVGGTVSFAGRMERTVIGSHEDWDILVIATYPSRKAFLQLFLDPQYRAAFQHRRAAVERYAAVMGAAR